MRVYIQRIMAWSN